MLVMLMVTASSTLKNCDTPYYLLLGVYNSLSKSPSSSTHLFRRAIKNCEANEPMCFGGTARILRLKSTFSILLVLRFAKKKKTRVMDEMHCSSTGLEFSCSLKIEQDAPNVLSSQG